MRRFVTLHINWLITNASYYRNFKTRRERDRDPSRSWSRARYRVFTRNCAPTNYQSGGIPSREHRFPSALTSSLTQDISPRTTLRGILLPPFCHRVFIAPPVTFVPCFIRARDGCCTNVFIRLNSRPRFLEIARAVTRGSGRARGKQTGTTSRGRGRERAGEEENCAWIVFPLPRPEENL